MTRFEDWCNRRGGRYDSDHVIGIEQCRIEDFKFIRSDDSLDVYTPHKTYHFEAGESKTVEIEGQELDLLLED